MLIGASPFIHASLVGGGVIVVSESLSLPAGIVTTIVRLSTPGVGVAAWLFEFRKLLKFKMITVSKTGTVKRAVKNSIYCFLSGSARYEYRAFLTKFLNFSI